jgi:8-amino-3,8-dideoxy-alpha-D-manno-octulosonate transaminase
MSELQGAVGIVQLSKINTILKNQRNNKKEIWNKIKDIEGIEPRKVPINSNDSCDALVFFVPSKKIAIKCRKELLKIKISTKILPEATKWHFAKEWEHMPELIKFHKSGLKKSFPLSSSFINRAVALPISAVKSNNESSKIKSVLTKVLRDKLSK